MLIISPFRDYYDKAMGVGVDKSIIYRRETQVIPLTSKEWRASATVFGAAGPWEITPKVLGFCGGLYPVIFAKAADQTMWLWDENEFQRGLGYIDAPKKYFTWGGSILATKTRTGHYNAHSHVGLLGLFQEHKVPVFLWSQNELVLDPQLAPTGFVGDKDPWTAFQDIMMYISGVLGTDAKVPLELSDKDKASKAGHDGVYSFKKPPGGKPWR